MSLNFPSSPAPVNGDEYYYSPTNTTYIFESGIWLVKSSNVVSGGGGATIQNALSPASSTKGASVDAVNSILQDSIANGVVDKAPTVNAVFDAIAAVSAGSNSWIDLLEHAVTPLESEIELTGIPSNAKVIKIVLQSLSENSVHGNLMQLILGTSSAYVTSNNKYIGECVRIGFDTHVWSDDPSYKAIFAVCGGEPDDEMYGEIELVKIGNTDKWLMKGNNFNPVGSGAITLATGVIILSTPLTRLKLAFTGSAQFDSGKVCVMYQS